MAAIVLVSPRCWNTMYMGMVSNATGSSNPPIMTPIATFLPGKRNLARPYPAITEMRVPMTPATVEYTSEFSTHRQNMP